MPTFFPHSKPTPNFYSRSASSRSRLVSSCDPTTTDVGQERDSSATPQAPDVPILVMLRRRHWWHMLGSVGASSMVTWEWYSRSLSERSLTHIFPASARRPRPLWRGRTSGSVHAFQPYSAPVPEAMRRSGDDDVRCRRDRVEEVAHRVLQALALALQGKRIVRRHVGEIEPAFNFD